MASFSFRSRSPGDTGVLRALRRALVLLAVAAVLGACSGGDDADEAAGRQEGAGTPAHGFTLTAADVHAMAPQPPPLGDDVKAAVKATLDTWLGNGVVAPLSTGKPPGGLEGVFTAPALGRVTAPGPDRSALLEEGSELTGEVRQERANAGLTALTAPAGDVVLVTALLDIVLMVASGDGTVAVSRSGELVLVPENGAWRIDAYDVRTTRDTQPGGGR